jgi:hypothetical protein
LRTFLPPNVDPTARMSFSPPPSDYTDALVLSANTAKRHPIPAGAKFVSFSSPIDFWAKFGSSTVTAAAPSADVTDGSAGELNPTSREIPDGITHISVVSAVAGTVALSFYG